MKRWWWWWCAACAIFINFPTRKLQSSPANGERGFRYNIYINISFSSVAVRTGQGTVVWFSFFFFECRASFPIRLDCIFNMSRNYCAPHFEGGEKKVKYLNGPVSFADTADNNKTTLRHTSLNRARNNSLFFFFLPCNHPSSYV